MSKTILRMVQWCAEFLPKTEIKHISYKARGIYALYKKSARNKYDVLYIGIADKSIKNRLYDHLRSKRMRLWTHFSIYVIWPNISEDEIREFEGLLLQIFRKDSQVRLFNIIKRSGSLQKVRERNLKKPRKMWLYW